MAIHSPAAGMYRVNSIDKATMRPFDETCLTKLSKIAAAGIKRLLDRNKVSHPHKLD